MNAKVGGVKKREKPTDSLRKKYFPIKDPTIVKGKTTGVEVTSLQHALMNVINNNDIKTNKSDDSSQYIPSPLRSSSSSKSSDDNAAITQTNKTLIKRNRKRGIVIVGPRPPSQRAAAAAARKALKTIQELGNKKILQQGNKKPKGNEEGTTKPKGNRKPKGPGKLEKINKVDYDTIVKRNLSDVITYNNKEEYVEEFTDLFNKHIPLLKGFVHEHAMNKQRPLTDDDVSLTILQLTDDLYFTIRDKLIMINNGLSPRSPI